MKKAVPLLKSGTILFLAFLLIFHTNAAKIAIQNGLQLCTGSVLPVLFPFFVLSDLWIRCGAAGQAASYFAPIMETLFHLPGNSASAFLLGSIGGYPVGARTAAQLYRNGALNKETAEQVLMFCNNAGPSFTIGVVGFGVFQSATAGILLYAIHLLSAIGIGIMFRPKTTVYVHSPIHMQNETFLTACKNSITEGGITAITVCTFILFFSVIIGCISSLLSPSLLSRLAIPGLLEITSGFQALSSAALPPRISFAISALLLGLGGGCVLLQAITFTEGAGLSCAKMLIGKTMQGAVSAAAAYTLWPILPEAQLIQGIGWIIEASSQWLIILLIFLPILLLLKKSSGKKAESHI